MPPKRRATSPVRPSPSKKQHTSPPAPSSAVAEPFDIIQREFYPAEISNERCQMYHEGKLTRPLAALHAALADSEARRQAVEPGACVVHWFKRDLRLFDNTALHMAGERARNAGVPLVCLYVVSPQDYQAHAKSAVSVDFALRSLEVVKRDLDECDIPLLVETVERRRLVPEFIWDRCKEWGARHVYCNIEYEVDELRREAGMVTSGLEKGIAFEAVHDDAVVPPGRLSSGQGKQYSVYSPWYRAWVKHIHDHPYLLDAHAEPERNPPEARLQFQRIFESPIPTAPDNKRLSDDERTRFAHLWPAGEHEGSERLQRFLAEKVAQYKDARNLPASNGTAMLSVHLSAGTLAARTAVRSARSADPSSRLDAGPAGPSTWISELAWRDFYKHVLAHWPYVCMYKPFKYEYADVSWITDPAAFARWCSGTTGFPIVDAAMRQLKSTAHMHNRCRMIAASFLAKDLLLDWRLGERYFSLHLVDADFASNSGGWGFASSAGVDPQPYFRIFNPLLQSEKFDPDGAYIRTWIPELRGIEGKAVHDPYRRGMAKAAAQAGYPEPMLDHSVARERALERFKSGLGRGTANVGGGVHN